MKKFIVIFNDRYQEEIELNGFMTMTDKEAESYEQLLNDISWSFQYPVADGMNLDYTNGEHLLSMIEFKEITNDEYKMFERVFNGSFGIFIEADYLLALTDEEQEDLELPEDDIDEDY